jgi:hypothetical protein
MSRLDSLIGFVKRFYRVRLRRQPPRWFVIACVCVAAKAADASGQAATVSASGAAASVAVTGVVIENNKGCERDAICFLRVRSEVSKAVWRVIYHPGEGERRCAQSRLTQLGLGAKVGDEIRAEGLRVADTSTEAGLDICATASAQLLVFKRR